QSQRTGAWAARANAGSATASCTAPGVPVATQLDFRVKVTDSAGATNTDVVHVIVLPVAGSYTVKQGDSWQTIAASLYGSSSVATQLQSALGNPPLLQGNVLTGFPASLTGTVSATVTVPAYYTVSGTDNWTTITQAVYGTGDPNAVSALQTAVGSPLPALTQGLHLKMPLTLTYTPAAGGNAVQADIVDPLGLM